MVRIRAYSRRKPGNKYKTVKVRPHRRSLIQYNFDEMVISKTCVILALMWEGQKEGDNYGFTELVKRTKGFMTRIGVSKAEDRLMDYGMINTKWVGHDKYWGKVYTVSSEAQRLAEGFLKYMGTLDRADLPKMPNMKVEDGKVMRQDMDTGDWKVDGNLYSIKGGLNE